ncbi:MAG: 50S ribosomal protein L5 [Puniceicoccales bacterium]|jgi:large subunit ribosomal protein L5|nr:50S ribosomal protein L5 [Puniceicoccales bacterium]
MEKSILKKYYSETVSSELVKLRGYGNRHLIPHLEKIVVNSAIGADWDKNFIAEVERDIGAICCQKPIIVKAKKSISNFKLRKGMPNGIKATLRGNSMYEFFYKLVSIALPAVRDFRGVSNKFDGRGNYTLGVVDHTIFPEVSIGKERKLGGWILLLSCLRKRTTKGVIYCDCWGFRLGRKVLNRVYYGENFRS